MQLNLCCLVKHVKASRQIVELSMQRECEIMSPIAPMSESSSDNDSGKAVSASTFYSC